MRVPTFDGNPKNWNQFNYAFLSTMICKPGLGDGMVNFDLSAADEQELQLTSDYVRRNRLLFGFLVSSIDQEATVAHLVCRTHFATGDGRAAWKDLVCKYAGTTSARMMEMLKEFRTMRMSEGEDPDTHILRLTHLRAALEAIGEPITDGNMLTTVLQGLPPSYEAAVELIEFNGTMTLPQVQAALKRKYDKRQRQLLDSAPASFLSQAAPAAAPVSAPASAKFRGLCNKCGKPGHRAADCYSKKPKQKQQQQQQRKAAGGGTGDKFCEFHNSRSHNTADCKALQGGSGPSANLAVVAAAAAGPLEPPKGKEGTPGIAGGVHKSYFSSIGDKAGFTGDCLELLTTGDCGSNRHVFDPNTVSWDMKAILVNMRPCTAVHITGVGGICDATHVADVRAYAADDKGKGALVYLSDVLIAPGAGANLICVSLLESAGGGITIFGGKRLLHLNGINLPLVRYNGLYRLLLRGSSRSSSQRFSDDRQLAGMGPKSNGSTGQLAGLEPKSIGSGNSENLALLAVSPMVLHRRLGHLNWRDTMALANGVGTGITCDLRKASELPCETCQLAKSRHQAPMFNARQPPGTTVKGSFMHSDIAGPVAVRSLQGNTWMHGFTCDNTAFSFVFFCGNKSDALDNLQQLVLQLAKAAVQILVVYWDNAKEFWSQPLQEYCDNAGIKLQGSAPYMAQENGFAERRWQVWCAAARCLLHEASLPPSLWQEAMACAVYIRNRTPTKALGGKTPYQAWHGERPDLAHLRVFGARAYVHLERSAREGSKFGLRAWVGRFVGYSEHNNCYRIYNESTRRIIDSRHVTFIEMPGDVPVLPAGATLEGSYIRLPPGAEEAPPVPQLTPHSQEPAQQQQQQPAQQQQQQPTAQQQQPAAQQQQQLGCLTRTEHQAHLRAAREAARDRLRANLAMLKFDSTTVDNLVTLAVIAGGTRVPNTYKQAMASPERNMWEAATIKEFDALVANGTWSLVPREHGMNVVGARWVFNVKSNAEGKIVIYKARFVAKGFSQQPGIDYDSTFAPVVELVSVRAVVAMACHNNWHMRQADVENAFVQSNDLQELVYVEQPEGFTASPDGRAYVLRLNKPLYGLKQSPREWHKTVSSYLVEVCGYTACAADQCVLLDPTTGVIIVLYVDDLLLTGTTASAPIDAAFAKLQDRFRLKDLGEPSYFLGISLSRDMVNGTFAMSQERYIASLLARFNMEEYAPVGTPMLYAGDNRVVSDLLDKQGAERYRSLVGGLLWISNGTRPDIAYSMSVLSQHMANPCKHHMLWAERVLCFLKGQPYGLTFTRSNDLQLVCYVDAAYANDPVDRRSTSGYVYMLGGAAIAWRAKKQKEVVVSSTEAEYLALFHAGQRAVLLRSLLKFLGMAMDAPTAFMEDNTAAKLLAEDASSQQRTKHIDVKYHRIRELVAEGAVQINMVRTFDQHADIFTKPLNRVLHAKHGAFVLGLV
jgi:Reverse transcriptase (RNA-dependent DNA polymerase)/gag-polypeptide of LTR copia-type/Zinc knuckle